MSLAIVDSGVVNGKAGATELEVEEVYFAAGSVHRHEYLIAFALFESQSC